MTVLTGVAVLSALPAPGSAGDEAPVDFQSQVRPILSDACFECHGVEVNYAKDRVDTTGTVWLGLVQGTVKFSVTLRHSLDLTPEAAVPNRPSISGNGSASHHFRQIIFEEV